MTAALDLTSQTFPIPLTSPATGKDWSWFHEPQFIPGSGLCIIGHEARIYVIDIHTHHRVCWILSAKVRFWGLRHTWALGGGKLYAQDGPVLIAWDLSLLDTSKTIAQEDSSQPTPLYAHNLLTNDTWQKESGEDGLAKVYQLQDDKHVAAQSQILSELRRLRWNGFFNQCGATHAAGGGQSGLASVISSLEQWLGEYISLYPQPTYIIGSNLDSPDQSSIIFTAPVVRQYQVGANELMSVFTQAVDGTLYYRSDDLSHGSAHAGSPTNTTQDLVLVEDTSSSRATLYYHHQELTDIQLVAIDVSKNANEPQLDNSATWTAPLPVSAVWKPRACPRPLLTTSNNRVWGCSLGAAGFFGVPLGSPKDAVYLPIENFDKYEDMGWGFTDFAIGSKNNFVVVTDGKNNVALYDEYLNQKWTSSLVSNSPVWPAFTGGDGTNYLQTMLMISGASWKSLAEGVALGRGLSFSVLPLPEPTASVSGALRLGSSYASSNFSELGELVSSPGISETDEILFFGWRPTL